MEEGGVLAEYAFAEGEDDGGRTDFDGDDGVI